MLPAGMIRYVIDGSLPGGEVFAHSQAFQPQFTPVDQAALNTFAEQAWTNFKTSFLTAAVQAFFSIQVTWTGARAYLIGPDGKAALQAVSTTAAKSGTDAGVLIPHQNAFVITMLTGAPGRARRGRAYLPPLRPTSLGSGQVVAATVTGLVDAYMAWLQAVADDAVTPALGSVASSHTSAIHTITSVRGDSVMDTQRRRRDKLVATAEHLSAPLVP